MRSFKFFDSSSKENNLSPEQLFSKAAREGNVGKVSTLLAQNVDVNYKDMCFNEATPLHHSAFNCHFKVMKLLLSSGARVDITDAEGCTPLHHTAFKGNKKCMALLIEHGSDINHVDIDKSSPLHKAAFNGNYSCVEYLILKGADIEQVDAEGISAMQKAAYNGHVKVIKLLLDKGADVHVADATASTSLHKAAYNGKADCVKLLIEKGANVNCVDFEGTTPLHGASYNGWKECVRVLLENNSNVDCVTNFNSTPLHFSAFNGHVESLILLASFGANLNLQDKKGMTPLHLAVKMEHKECIETLIERGANQKLRDTKNRRPKHLVDKTSKSGAQILRLLEGKGGSNRSMNRLKIHPLTTDTLNSVVSALPSPRRPNSKKKLDRLGEIATEAAQRVSLETSEEDLLASAGRKKLDKSGSLKKKIKPAHSEDYSVFDSSSLTGTGRESPKRERKTSGSKIGVITSMSVPLVPILPKLPSIQTKHKVLPPIEENDNHLSVDSGSQDSSKQPSPKIISKQINRVPPLPPKLSPRFPPPPKPERPEILARINGSSLSSMRDGLLPNDFGIEEPEKSKSFPGRTKNNGLAKSFPAMEDNQKSPVFQPNSRNKSTSHISGIMRTKGSHITGQHGTNQNAQKDISPHPKDNQDAKVDPISNEVREPDQSQWTESPSNHNGSPKVDSPQLRTKLDNVKDESKEAETNQKATKLNDTTASKNIEIYGRLDRYGFVRTKSEPRVAIEIKKRETMRSLKWNRMIKNWKAFYKKNRTKVKSRCEKGIPDCVRGAAWKLLSNTADVQENSTIKYKDLLNEESQESEQIERDISRTFPGHIFFSEKGQGQTALFHVLKAYSVYNKDIGYCQGMGFICALLLMYMPEEDAFWVLVQLLDHYELADLYRPGLPRLALCLYTLERLLQTHIPKIHRHLMENNVLATMYAPQWFITVFLYNMPFPVVLRIWDTFLFYGYRITYAFSLALFKMFEDKLLSMNFDELMNFLKFANNEDKNKIPTIDPDELLRLALSLRPKQAKLQQIENEYRQQQQQQLESPPS